MSLVDALVNRAGEVYASMMDRILTGLYAKRDAGVARRHRELALRAAWMRSRGTGCPAPLAPSRRGDRGETSAPEK